MRLFLLSGHLYPVARVRWPNVLRCVWMCLASVICCRRLEVSIPRSCWHIFCKQLSLFVKNCVGEKETWNSCVCVCVCSLVYVCACVLVAVVYRTHLPLRESGRGWGATSIYSRDSLASSWSASYWPVFVLNCFSHSMVKGAKNWATVCPRVLKSPPPYY